MSLSLGVTMLRLRYRSMASSLQDEAVRSLGLWMGVPPTYFMLPDVRLRVVARDGSRSKLTIDRT